jgi:hypothetical protein
VGSIPIARSINPVDAVGFTGFPPQNRPIKPSILDAVGREIRSGISIGRERVVPGAWHGPNVCLFGLSGRLLREEWLARTIPWAFSLLDPAVKP